MFKTFTQIHNEWREPEEDEIWSYDWKGNPIYYGDRYRNVEGDLVLEDEFDGLTGYVKEFFDMNYPVLIAGSGR